MVPCQFFDLQHDLVNTVDIDEVLAQFLTFGEQEVDVNVVQDVSLVLLDQALQLVSIDSALSKDLLAS